MVLQALRLTGHRERQPAADGAGPKEVSDTIGGGAGDAPAPARRRPVGAVANRQPIANVRPTAGTTGGCHGARRHSSR